LIFTLGKDMSVRPTARQNGCKHQFCQLTDNFLYSARAEKCSHATIKRVSIAHFA
jgi:hypothetical protein